jgi:hypothetical protein
MMAVGFRSGLQAILQFASLPMFDEINRYNATDVSSQRHRRQYIMAYLKA